MRLLFFANDFPSPWLPTKGTFNFELARSLASRHEVQVVAPIPWLDELYRGMAVDADIARTRSEIRDGLTIHYPRYYYTPKVLRSWYDWYMWHSVKSVLKNLADFRPEAVIGYWPYPDGSVAVRFARQMAAASFVMAGGSGILIHALESEWRRRKIVDTLNAADGVLAVSADLRQKTIDLGVPADNVHLVYRGVDRDRFFPGDKDAARRRLGLTPAVPLFLWVGRMVPVKGLDVLLQAAASLKRRGRPFELVLAGDGFERRRFEAVAAALGLCDAARFVGPVLHHELSDWYRAADWTVLTSHSEGVPNVLLESHACGTPFIATRVGGVAEIAVEGVDRLVAPADHEGFAEQMFQALANTAVNPQEIAARVSGLETAANAISEIVGRVVAESRVGSPARRDHRAVPVTAGGAAWAPTLFDSELPNSEAGRSANTNDSVRHPSPLRQAIRRGMSAILPYKLFLTAGSQHRHDVFLTFDDGPHPDYTPRLLDVLGELGIKATFFVIGREAARNPQIVRRMAAEGHAVGGHTWFHPTNGDRSIRAFAHEVVRTNDLLASITGTPVRLFRPPLGKPTVRQMLVLWRLKQTVVLWNVDPKDYQCDTADDVSARLPHHGLRGGDILLLHDVFPFAAAIVPAIADRVTTAGLRFSTILELTGGGQRAVHSGSGQ